MPRALATLRASSTASIEQQPRSLTTSRSLAHSASVMPIARTPRWAARAATALEGTPPDIATATTAEGGRWSSGSSATSAGDRRDDGEFVALADRRVETLADADV